jgi:chemotaxis response regulator CheB
MSGGLNNVVRRDAISKYLIETALNSGDARYLDKMPPEWKTPEIEAQFVEARRKVETLNWETKQREVAMEKQKREEESRKTVAEGLPLDPKRYANNSEAFNYALEKARTEPMIDPVRSQTAANDLARTIEGAAMTNNFAKVLGPEFEVKGASLSDIEKAIDNRTDIKAADRIALKQKLQTLVNVGVMAGGEEAMQHFNRSMGDDLRLLQQSMYSKLDPMNVPNFAGKAKQVYDLELQSRIRAYVEDPKLDSYSEGSRGH